MPDYEKYPRKLWNVGATANLVYLHGDSGRVTVANVGDSRAMQAKDGRIESLSYDHKPMDEEERERIYRNGF